MIERTSITHISIRDKASPLYLINFDCASDVPRKKGCVAEVKYLIDFLEMFEMSSIYFNRDANAIYFELVEDGRSYAFRYSFNKVSDGDSNGSNIKKINDNWLLIADE